MKICFACDKEIKVVPYFVTTKDGQVVNVGPDCFKRVNNAERQGYQPVKGGPRLYTIDLVKVKS